MGSPNLPPEPEEAPRLEGRELIIAMMGAVAFRIEQGPNANVPEKLQPKSEQADHIPPESVE